MRRAEPPAAPDIFSYVDFRAYLRDWRAARAAATGRPYSLGMLARKADIPKTVVQAVARGARKLLPPYVDRLIAALDLDAEEAAHFVLMVRYTQAEAEAERQAVRVEMVRSPRCFRATENTVDGFLLFSDPARTAIFEMANMPSFRPDPSWISARLRHPRVTEDAAADALEALVTAGLLVPDEAGVPRPCTPELLTAPVVPVEQAMALNLQHEGAIRLAAETLCTDDAGVFTGVVGQVPSESLAALRADIMDFQWRVIGMLRDASERAAASGVPGAAEPRVVVQFTSQLFSLADRTSLLRTSPGDHQAQEGR